MIKHQNSALLKRLTQLEELSKTCISNSKYLVRTEHCLGRSVKGTPKKCLFFVKKKHLTLMYGYVRHSPNAPLLMKKIKRKMLKWINVFLFAQMEFNFKSNLSAIYPFCQLNLKSIKSITDKRNFILKWYFILTYYNRHLRVDITPLKMVPTVWYFYCLDCYYSQCKIF